MIEKYTTKEEGYHPFFISNGWQVAQLNYLKDQNIDNIKKMDVHFMTDEIFVLMYGEAVLISSTIINDTPNFEVELMRKGIIYNIPKNVWHNIAMKEGSEVLIVEKSDTHLGDFEFYELKDEQIAELKRKVCHCFEDSN